MDLDEWEYLPDDGFLDFHDNGQEKRIFSPRKRSSDSKSVFNMDYFIIPSPNSRQKVVETPATAAAAAAGNSTSRVPKSNQLVPFPIQLEPPRFGKAPSQGLDDVDDDELVVKEVVTNEVPNSSVVVPSSAITHHEKSSKPPDVDTLLSQVYFKKTWENHEFVDMKMDSPKSPTRGFMHQTDHHAGNNKFQFDDKSETYKGDQDMDMEPSTDVFKEEELVNWEQGNSGGGGGRHNIWKLSFTGIGAICSFGFAAATICILFFGTHQRNKQYQQDQKRFQIYTDDKRIKQAVHQATKLNEAMAAVRGVPLSRAHITFGGYYNGL